MIEKQIIKVPEVRAHEKEVTTYGCDFCDHKNTDKTRFTICHICKRMVCKGWMESCVKRDPEEWGDYPDPYCPTCYKLRFTKYKKYIDSIRDRADEEEEAFIRKIKLESLGII